MTEVKEQTRLAGPFSEWGLGISRPLVIAGPCSAETEAQVLATAERIASDARVKVFRAGIWKPRTRPDHFEGAGEGALPWLARVKRETGLFTITEVANAEHVEACLKAGIDMLWIGARTTPNPFAVQEIANALRGVDIPVFVKNPVNPDLQLWIGALERFHKAGLHRLAAVHRGFSWFGDRSYRNSPMWEFPIRLKAHFPELEVICDPSHIAGRRDGLAEVAQKALDLNLSGFMIETHIAPDEALSDAQQQIAPDRLRELLDGLVLRAALPPDVMADRLLELRDLIDRIDDELAQKLAARAEIVDQIGAHKFDHNVAIPQPERFEQILQKQRELAERLGLSGEFMDELMNAIHNESIRRQTRVWDALEVKNGRSGSRSTTSNGKS